MSDELADGVEVQSSALTAQQRLAACARDPRVLTGLVSQQICAGADIFFRETFGGNGRTCGTCHPMSNNTTIDVPFVQSLPASDPLFVFERDSNLTNLETPDLRSHGGILENVDGFEDPVNKFTVRSVPHVLSMKTSLAPDTVDGTTIPPVERTGWGGDGAPGDGSLRQFLNGAITQHYPKTLQRRIGPDFRLATNQELDLVVAFQLALGRLNELNLQQVNLTDAAAQDGKNAYVDPFRGRCNACHFNGGATNDATLGKNRNFDTGTRKAQGFPTVPTFDGVFLFDGGFGGQGLAHPNFHAIDVPGQPGPNSFGNGTFNTPPAIEAADTLPSFHTNAFGGNIESTVSFYATTLFTESPAARDLDARFRGPANVGPEVSSIGRFLRALNVALNLDMAKQRLRASQTILNRFRDQHAAIQKELIRLAEAELDDALTLLADPLIPQPFYPISVDRIGLAKQEIARALAATNSVGRQGPLSNAISRVENARDPIGSNITFTLGQGNLMF